MESIIEGIKFGIILTILVGPILFALIQVGIERGFKAGVMVGFGVWVSDLIYIVLAFFGVSYVIEIAKWDGFALTLGIGGGIILIAVGVGTFFTRPPEFDENTNYLGNENEKLPSEKKGKIKEYAAYWMKGFLINTVNPFTVFFWLSVVSAVIPSYQFSREESLFFFGAILGTIIVTDVLKVVLAKVIRNFLKPKYILLVRRISGVAFVIFGVALILRVLFWDAPLPS